MLGTVRTLSNLLGLFGYLDFRADISSMSLRKINLVPKTRWNLPPN